MITLQLYYVNLLFLNQVNNFTSKRCQKHKSSPIMARPPPNPKFKISRVKLWYAHLKHYIWLKILNSQSWWFKQAQSNFIQGILLIEYIEHCIMYTDTCPYEVSECFLDQSVGSSRQWVRKFSRIEPNIVRRFWVKVDTKNSWRAVWLDG